MGVVLCVVLRETGRVYRREEILMRARETTRYKEIVYVKVNGTYV